MRYLVSTFVLLLLSAGSVLASESVEPLFSVQNEGLRRAPSPSLQQKTRKPPTTIKIKRELLLRKVPKLRPIKTPDPAEPQGPDPHVALDLVDVISDSDLLRDLSQACGWDSHLIFQDKAAGHVFYYLPREFLLLRDQNGYRLSVQYNTRAEPGEPSVLLTAELASPHHHGDVGLLKAILREALELKPADNLQLRSLGGLGATMDMEALSTGLSLSEDRVHITPPAHLKEPFRLTLVLTQDEVEEVLAQIAREGVAGSLRVKVGEEFVPIPIRIQYTRFAGEYVQAFSQWVQGRSLDKLVNTTDFPLKVESINAYRMKGDRLVRISKELKKTSPIPPGGRRPFKLPAASRVLGEDLLFAWLGTTLETDCSVCVEAVDRKVRKGVALAPGSRLTLEGIPPVFSEFGLYKIIVRIRSPYFVSGGTEVLEHEVTLTQENNVNTDLSIFVPSDRGPDPLLYRYRLQAVTQAGETIEQDNWHDARGLSQFFGATHLEDLLGEQAPAE
ncbi:MAG: hypothetical protein ACLFVT_01445 [Syntrophobacteria bacterium]